MLKLAAGLGNPGTKYTGTRHNVGFAVINEFSKKFNFPNPEKECQALTSQAEIFGGELILAQPLTFMNKSGKSILQLKRKYEVNVEDILIIYDDLDLALGRLRFRKSGSSGGHRGVESIVQNLKSLNFHRLKIGIGNPENIDPRQYVLSKFADDEEKLVGEILKTAVQGITVYLNQGISEAMNKFNGLVLEI